MTPEEVKRTVVEGLRAQGKRAAVGAGTCVYLTPDGCRCAVGQLVPEDLYDPAMETATVRYLEIRGGRWVPEDPHDAASTALARVLNAAGVPATGEVHEFLRAAQHVHDRTLDASFDKILLDIEELPL